MVLNGDENMLGKDELREVVEICTELSMVKDKHRLLEKMLIEAMNISECDAGTIYLYRDETLEFMVMKTLSMGVSNGENGEKIDLPPVPLKEGNVCAYSAIHHELINIPDVYTSDRFDFSGPKKYDAITGYRTGSMLVIPMMDGEDQLVGVLQLMNKLDKDHVICTFTEDDEFAIRSLGSIAAVLLSNMSYLEELKAQMESFVQAFATAVDERTPYNGSHTRKVAEYAGILADYINQKYESGESSEYFSEKRRSQLFMSAMLHDIGKMIVPLSVMNKETRLDGRMNLLEDRFEILSLSYERDMLANKITKEENQTMQQYLKDSLAFIKEVNVAGFLHEEKMNRIVEIASHKYIKANGEQVAFLTEDEVNCLCIQKGTLTDEERQLMESHVVMTQKILEKVRFRKSYEKVVQFASTHHEFLNGTGYPNHLTREDLELESRILTVVDIYDALTSTDRPYKKPIPRDKAFSILYSMVMEGKLDEQLVRWLDEALRLQQNA